MREHLLEMTGEAPSAPPSPSPSAPPPYASKTWWFLFGDADIGPNDRVIVHVNIGEWGWDLLGWLTLVGVLLWGVVALSMDVTRLNMLTQEKNWNKLSCEIRISHLIPTNCNNTCHIEYLYCRDHLCEQGLDGGFPAEEKEQHLRYYCDECRIFCYVNDKSNRIAEYPYQVDQIRNKATYSRNGHVFGLTVVAFILLLVLYQLIRHFLKYQSTV